MIYTFYGIRLLQNADKSFQYKYAFYTEDIMQQCKKLLAQWHTDPQTGFEYRYVISQTERLILHSHDYYELFLVTDGKVIHTVNGVTSVLKAGDLVFIRPSDEHIYSYDGTNNFCFANLSFITDIAEKMFSFLDGGYNVKTLLESELPPTVSLTTFEMQKVLYSLQSINTASYADTSEKILKMKFVLFSIFAKYFSRYTINEKGYSVWFEYLCDELKKPINFQKHKPNMTAICGKSKEHISRSFKKNLGMTPSEYLTDIRLNYAANLLKNTDISVIEISLEAGFENLSWFYKKFAQKFGTTPKKFRI